MRSEFSARFKVSAFSVVFALAMFSEISCVFLIPMLHSFSLFSEVYEVYKCLMCVLFLFDFL